MELPFLLQPPLLLQLRYTLPPLLLLKNLDLPSILSGLAHNSVRLRLLGVRFHNLNGLGVFLRLFLLIFLLIFEGKRRLRLNLLNNREEWIYFHFDNRKSSVGKVRIDL